MSDTVDDNLVLSNLGPGDRTDLPDDELVDTLPPEGRGPVTPAG